MEINELSKNAKGGTELMLSRLHSLFTEQELAPYQIIASRVRDLKTDKKIIYWAHDTATDPETHFLSNSDIISKFAAFVFVSYHQMNQFLLYYPLLPRNKVFVIENAIEPITEIERQPILKDRQEIKLIYTSTPHRGLNILLNVFNVLSKTENISLDVFSSFNIYGWPERDKPYEELFEFCRQHPKINYHGTQPNQVVRKALGRSHIFCLPSTWEETSCLALIEAMSSGNLCVHSSLGALPETSMGLFSMYPYTDNIAEHHQRFGETLLSSIRYLRNNNYYDITHLKSYIDNKYGLNRFKWQWEQVFISINT